MWVFYSACMFVYYMYLWSLERKEEDDRSPLTDGCQLPRGCWEPNSGTAARSLNCRAISPALDMCFK